MSNPKITNPVFVDVQARAKASGAPAQTVGAEVDLTALAKAEGVPTRQGATVVAVGWNEDTERWEKTTLSTSRPEARQMPDGTAHRVQLAFGNVPVEWDRVTFRAEPKGHATTGEYPAGLETWKFGPHNSR